MGMKDHIWPPKESNDGQGKGQILPNLIEPNSCGPNFQRNHQLYIYIPFSIFLNNVKSSYEINLLTIFIS